MLVRGGARGDGEGRDRRPRARKHVGGDASMVPAAWYIAQGRLARVRVATVKILEIQLKYT